MGFTSVATGEAELGELYVSDIFYVVCEKRPLCLTQIASISAGKGIDPALIDTLYSASVYYKKSLNPIGPSSLPIHVFSMAFTNTELSMKPRGLWAKITGKPFEPEMVMLMHYSADGVKIVGSLDNDFDRQTAYKTMIFKVCEELVMHRNEFKHLGNLKDFGPDSPAIQ